MSSIQLVSLLLVLVCMHLHFVVAVGGGEALECNKTSFANHTVAQRTGTDALNALVIAGKYLGGKQKIAGLSPDKWNECGNISLIDIPPDSGLQGTADASSNLNKLLYMYRSVLRNLALSETVISKADSSKMELLEIVFTRLSNQVEWYLQFRRCVCNHTQCTVSESIDKFRIQEEIQMMHMQPNCTYMRSLNVIVHDLRNAANNTLTSLPDWTMAYSIRSYQLCHTLKALRSHCETGSHNCTAK